VIRAILLTLILQPFHPQVAQNEAEEIRRLEAQHKGQFSRVRTLVADSKVRYDTDGRIIGKWRPGQWTWHSGVKVTKVELLKGDILEIRADRILLNYSRAIHKFQPLLTTETFEVEIQVSREADGKLNLEKEWNKAFLGPVEPYPQGIQDYWKPFIECVRNPETEECKFFERKSREPDVLDLNPPTTAGEPKHPDVYKVGGDVIAPKVRSRVEPEYTVAARNARIEGMTMLNAIVAKDGSIRILRIVRPIGFGLEEAAAEALSKWRFQPATLLGQPVDVSLFIEVNFHLRR